MTSVLVLLVMDEMHEEVKERLGREKENDDILIWFWTFQNESIGE